MSRLFVAECDGCGWSKAYRQAGRADHEAARHSCPEPKRTHRRRCRTCGWSGSYRSAAKADFCKRRHSCARRIARAEAAERGRARHAAVDRTPQPCRHKQADHVHGTYACYVADHCRCEPCTKSNSDYEAKRTRLQAYGRWGGLVDAQPAREHVACLAAQGMGLKRIVAVTDISQGALWKLVYGKRRPDGTRTPSRRITPSLERRILAVSLDLAGGAQIPAVGTQRRIQALVAIGYSMSQVAARIDMLGSNLAMLLGRRCVQRSTADKVAALYDELSMLPPTPTRWHEKAAVTRSRRMAAERGWAPPLAWDDDTIDDPAAAPASPGWRPTSKLRDDEVDEAAVERRRLGDKSVRLSQVDRLELVRRMLAAGVTKKEIERRTGVNVERERREAIAPRFCAHCAKTPAPDRVPCERCDGYRKSPRSIAITDDDTVEIPTPREKAA